MTPSDLHDWLIAQPKRPTRVEVAHRYADILVEHWNRLGSVENWAVLNNAILARWSIAGLNFIKQQAWKVAEAAMRERAKAGVQ